MPQTIKKARFHVLSRLFFLNLQRLYINENENENENEDENEDENEGENNEREIRYNTVNMSADCNR